jgi:penicillin-binding protein 2
MLGRIYANDQDLFPTLLKKTADARRGKKPVRSFNAKYIEIIKDALFKVCNAGGGTASASCKRNYGISGKTGSSQVRRLKAGEAGLVNLEKIPWQYRDHAFFVGCAPYKNPKYVVAVLIEHGGWGSIAAAPVAAKIFDRLMQAEKSKSGKSNPGKSKSGKR